MRLITALPFVFLLAASAPAAAPAGTTPPAKTAGDDTLKRMIAEYPLDTCVISGEKLGDGGAMGDIVNHIHREPGKPDRLVRLCCRGCLKDFKKDPAKYLKLIDEAAAKKPKKSAT